MRRVIPRLSLVLLLAFAPSASAAPEDPVPGLTDGEAATVEAGLDDKECQALLDAYVSRVEATYTAKAKPPEGLLEWLQANPEARSTFWLALVPGQDDLAAAMKVLDALRREDPEKTAKYFQLAVALSVVWDRPESVTRSQRYTIHGVGDGQWPAPPGFLETFRYFTETARQKRFLFKPDDMVWPLLVHVVDFDVGLDEAAWALDKFETQKKTIDGTYAQVAYDYDKLKNGVGKLGTNPYTLPNLLRYGGVCGDQSHFCSRVAKCFGIPAMKAAGLSRYGGVGHAFVCYEGFKKGHPVLLSTGRYFGDNYYVGDVFDPQTGTGTSDRDMAMTLDGASLSYPKFLLARALARIAEKAEFDRPAASLALAKKAITTNYFCGTAWRLLMRKVKDGAVKPEEGLEWANTMCKYLGEHPDLTLECFSTFLGCLPREDVKKRQSFYTQVAKVYEERPDLLIELKIAQVRELVEAGKESEAASVSIATCAEQGKEGRLILPLIKPAIVYLNKKADPRAFPLLDKMVMRFPKERMGEMSESFQELARMLVPIYEAMGLKKEADSLRRKAQIG
ncbi:MAG: hypothetical protein MUC63_02220 [Planctomycetes bacterium]|nr:hypothetical protein [Planctomycetota bacterium]